METDNETTFRLSVSVTLIHSWPLKKPAPSPGQISTGTGGQFSPGGNNVNWFFAHDHGRYCQKSHESLRQPSLVKRYISEIKSIFAIMKKYHSVR